MNQAYSRSVNRNDKHSYELQPSINKNKSRVKKTLFYLISCVLISSLFFSCQKEESFEETLLIGTWVSGTDYYKYISGGMGKNWDTSDEVTEEEATTFTWTLEQSELTHIFIMQIGGNVPKVYTVTELTSTTLKYEDEYSSYSYTRVN